ncbi:transcription termination factor Rho [bacterium]|uniref:Transcription termination factor Rho n=2 Tax=Katanobacteria TaxID=422282 RepID=A0A2M7X176_UNCKA|nr:transcription termination factor Rho [bacterium]PIP56614.1 MAG: transcription termination factor Rho [candidate division WWE3 bacterium CG22_combo_CG10-13_8_21_14_all_39_12]PJA39936.1 MAG: transcription termination factor Rho [candidate division WWE3 bacterium CG_4_9_14_3_um_filter_39_7]
MVESNSQTIETEGSDFAPDAETKPVSGVLDILQDFGFLRTEGLTPGPNDVYISMSQIRRFQLRMGDQIKGAARPPKTGEKYWGLLRVETVNGEKPDAATKRPIFKRLTPIYPEERLSLETTSKVITTRLVDLVAPIGRGQRAMIVSPPKAGKTTFLREVAAGIETNYPNVSLMVVLVGERPEEVTEMQRSTKGEVFASNFDERPEDQVAVASLALEMAKRRVEAGQDVVILVDSITRLARAHNLAIPPSGRTLSGGFDPAALYPPKHFFGAARNIEEGGSLTIIATALVDTGSRMDDLIYEEFKGTGNMELHLDRKLAERRVWPAIDIVKSGTRKEELLLSKDEMSNMLKLRRMMDTIGEGSEVNQLVIDRLRKTKNNKEFLETLHEVK